MIDPESVGDLYRFAENALNSMRDGASQAQGCNLPRRLIDGMTHSETPAAEIPTEVLPDFNQPEDI